jgi:D-glycero-alpha-D-manno-heptose-7-phosphate kinase
VSAHASRPNRPHSTVAQAWCRVDLAGGTLDIWPLGLLHAGARTVSVAIDVAVTVEIASRDSGYQLRQGDVTCEAETLAILAETPLAALPALIGAEFALPPFTATITSDSPTGGGLGASSAMAVAFLAAVEGHFGSPSRSAAERARVARDLEARLMQLPTGIQDHYPAQLGGALEISLQPGGERADHLSVDLDSLGDSLLIAYSGSSHFSAGENWRVVRRRLDGDPEVKTLLDRITCVATDLARALKSGDLTRVGALMSEEWAHRRQLAPGVSIPLLEELLTAAARAGAWGGKACGAGGGGCVAVLCPPDRREVVTRALAQSGGRPIRARPTLTPMQVIRRES